MLHQVGDLFELNVKLRCQNVKIDIKTAATCFGAVTPSSGSALFLLAKVTVVKTANSNTSVCGDVAAYISGSFLVYVALLGSRLIPNSATCPVFARYTLAFALQLRKKHGKTSVRVAGKCQLPQLILCFRIPREAWMSVCCECCVLSGRGLCYGLITLPQDSYRLWCVIVCDLETL